MKNPILLLSGATGVGTSTFSRELSHKLGIVSVTQTDLLRQALRSYVAPDINVTLGRSTYTAGQTKNYHNKKPEVQRAEIIRGYKSQCAAVMVGVGSIIERGIEENIPMIVEGAHLIPGKTRRGSHYKKHKDRFIEFLVYIGNPDVHIQRFVKRQQEAPEREIDKYIRNFKEIRWIHNYMLDRASQYEHIETIDNTGPLKNNLEKILRSYEIS